MRRYPLKGAAAVPERQLSVNTVVGVADDRKFGLRHRPGDVTQRAATFSKFDYVVCANAAAMAKERAHFAGSGAGYRLAPGYVSDISEPPCRTSATCGCRSHGAYHLADTGGPPGVDPEPRHLARA